MPQKGQIRRHEWGKLEAPGAPHFNRQKCIHCGTKKFISDGVILGFIKNSKPIIGYYPKCITRYTKEQCEHHSVCVDGITSGSYCRDCGEQF